MLIYTIVTKKEKSGLGPSYVVTFAFIFSNHDHQHKIKPPYQVINYFIAYSLLYYIE